MKKYSFLPAALLSACSISYQAPITVAPVVKASHQQAVHKMLNNAKRILLQAGYRIRVFDHEAGIITTSLKHQRLTPKQADCGKIMGMDYLKDNRTKTEMALNIIVTEQEITVKPSIQGKYNPENMDEDINLTCISKGLVEKQVLKHLLAG